MRPICLVILVAAVGGAVSAADLTQVSFGDALKPRTAIPDVNLFDTDEATSRPIFATSVNLGYVARGQFIEQEGVEPRGQNFGAGVSIGMVSNPIGVGLTGWFDVYILRYLAVSTQFQFGYGIITDAYENGGDALFAGVSIGVKFVMDFPDVEVNRWWRPFIALYPAGFLYSSATEEVEPPGTGNTEDFSYSDIYYHIYGGIGSDFYLAENIALGAALYISGTIGGSRHEEHDVTIRTEGGVQVFFEYARLSIRF